MARSLAVTLAALWFGVVGASLVHAADAGNHLQEKLTRFGYAPGPVVDKVENYRVDGWNYLDDTHIMIYAGPSRRYMIELMSTCYDLSTVEHIAFTSTVHELTKFDKLIVRGPGAGGMRQDCPIKEIRELTPLKKK